MSDLAIPKDVWNGVNDTQKPFSSASKLDICPDIKSKFQIIKHNLTKLKEQDSLWWPASIILLTWGKQTNKNLQKKSLKYYLYFLTDTERTAHSWKSGPLDAVCSVKLVCHDVQIMNNFHTENLTSLRRHLPSCSYLIYKVSAPVNKCIQCFLSKPSSLCFSISCLAEEFAHFLVLLSVL